jgi:hypothetical protein
MGIKAKKEAKNAQATLDEQKQTKAVLLAKQFVEIKENMEDLNQELGKVKLSLIEAMKAEGRTRIGIKAYDIVLKYTESKIEVGLKKNKI